MKHSITYYPVGSGDCALISADDDNFLMLVDYRSPSETTDRQPIDVSEKIREKMEDLGRDAFDVVVITHLDSDHVQNIEHFLHFKHDEDLQGSDRFEFDELWVPAAAILEDARDLKDSSLAIQNEALHRLKEEGEGVRVFSTPSAVDDLLAELGVSQDDLPDETFVQAGTCVSHTTMNNHGLEIFVHSPFAHRQEDNELIDRNRDSIVFQARFDTNSSEPVYVMFYSDLEHEALGYLKQVTQKYDNLDYLSYDLLKTPHHSSYKSLASDREKIPNDIENDIKYIFEDAARDRAIIVSSSCASAEENGSNPPHQEALDYYENTATEKSGSFHITNAYPSTDDPAPLVICIDDGGVTLEQKSYTKRTVVQARRPPRAG